MKLGYQTNTWGGVVGHPAGVTSVKDLFYLTNGSNEEALSDIHDAGYQGIEIFDGNLKQYSDIAHFQVLLDKYQLQLIAVYSGANFIYPDILDDELWRIEEAAKLGQRLNAEHLVVGGGAIRHDGIRDSDFHALAAGLDRVEKLGQKYSLKVSYHPHLGTMTESPENIDRLFDLTGIDFCPDTAHLVAGGADLLNLIRKYRKRIKYVHLKDLCNGTFLPLGQGELPFAAMMDSLVSQGFDGWVTVELDYFEGHPKRAAEISREYLNTIGLG